MSINPILKTKIIIVLLMTLLPQGILGNEPMPDRAGKGKDRILARIELAMSHVNTLACDFLEEKHLAILKDVVFSRGRFYFERPDCLRWERMEPAPSGFAVQGQKAVHWSGQDSPLKAFELGQRPGIKIFVNHVLAWIRADFDWLEKGYVIQVANEDPVALKLLPRSASEKSHLNHLLIIFARDLSYVRSVEIHEKDGDFTRIRFMNPVVNGPRPKTLF